MKYSLRSLMVVVTLACVLLGGLAVRIHYLRHMAAFHEQKAMGFINGLNNPAERKDMEWLMDELISRRGRVGEGAMEGSSEDQIFSAIACWLEPIDALSIARGP